MTNPTSEEEDKLAAAAKLYTKETEVKPETAVAPELTQTEAVAPVTAEVPKVEVAKTEAVTETSVETPKVEEVKVEVPKTEEIKTEAAKPEEVKTEAPKATEVPKTEETAKEKEEWIQASVKEWFHKVGEFFGDMSHKVVDFVSQATGKIASTPKSIEEFFEKNEDKIKNVWKWTLYVGTFKWILDWWIYAGKKTKQQIELTYSNAMENLRQKLSEVDRKTKIETVKKEDISFVWVDGSFFYSDKETWIATNINVETKEGKTISEEEFEKQKALVAK